MAAANAAIPRLQPDEVRKMMGAADVLIVDVRDPPEVQASGKIKALWQCREECWSFAPTQTCHPTTPPSRKTSALSWTVPLEAARHSQLRPFRRWATNRCSTPEGSRKRRTPGWIPNRHRL